MEDSSSVSSACSGSLVLSSSQSSVSVNYESFFVFPSAVSMVKDCVATCKLCKKKYKYTLTTKGNLLKHLKTAYSTARLEHKREQIDLRSQSQTTLATNGSIVRKQMEFKNQEAIIGSYTKNLCGRGGLPIRIIETPWFRTFMKDVEPRFTSVSRSQGQTKT